MSQGRWLLPCFLSYLVKHMQHQNGYHCMCEWAEMQDFGRGHFKMIYCLIFVMLRNGPWSQLQVPNLINYFLIKGQIHNERKTVCRKTRSGLWHHKMWCNILVWREENKLQLPEMILNSHKLICKTSGIAICGNGNVYDILFQKDF